MHDYFIDRIVKIDNLENFLQLIDQKTKVGGGSIRELSTSQIEGGNAVNLAFCLGKLGLKVELFTISDDIGSIILKNLFQNLNVNLHLSYGKPGYTTSLEFYKPNSTIPETNVMLSDVGDNMNFGPERIDSGIDLQILENADVIAAVNWGSNLKGTLLLKYVFENSPNAFHFVDPADIQTRKTEFYSLLMETNNIINVLSINENECNSLLSEMNYNELLLKDGYGPDYIKMAAKTIARKIGILLDLHTKQGTAFSDGNDVFFVNSIKNTKIKTLTGAGDAWDAANILGYMIELSAQERLFFANVFASLYTSSDDRQKITINKFSDFYNEMYSQYVDMK